MPGTDACLAGAQPDPPQPGRTDALVDGCPVCNLTRPCLYDILNDESERNNVADANPDIVKKLVRSVKENVDYYVTGSLTEQELEAYDRIDDPDTHWQGYSGPCYLKKTDLN